MSSDNGGGLTRRDLLLVLGATSVPTVAALAGRQLTNESGEAPPADVAFVVRDGSDYRAVTHASDLGAYPTADRAFDAVFSDLDGASVYTGSGKYWLESPLAVPEGFRVSNAADGMFVNGLPDEGRKCMEFAANTGSDYLKLDCAEGDGVLLGEENTGNHIDVRYADVHRVGTDGATRDAVRIQGNAVRILHLNTFRGTNGLALDDAYDVHVLSSIITNAGTGLRVDGAEHCFFDQMDFDSCRDYAVRIDDASGIELRGLSWNNTEFDVWPHRVVEIGTNDACDNVFTDMRHLSSPGTALYVDDLEASHLRHDVNEADESWFEYEAGVVTTERTAEDCFLEGYVAPSITDAVTGIEGGTVQFTGAGTDSGTHVTGGDGSATTFEIPHELGTDPDRVRVQPRSRAAAANFYVDGTDPSAITVEYRTPPPEGTENLAWDFEVRL